MGEHVQQDAPGALSPAVLEALAAIRQHPRNSSSGGAPRAQPVKRAKLKPDKAVKEETLAAFRNGFKATFGDAVGSEVFSAIDRRVSGGKEILGAEVQSAGLAAMEMVSPLIRFAKQKEKADAELAQARKKSAKADEDLAAATEDHADKRRTYDDIDDVSKSVSTLRVEVDTAKRKVDETDAASKAARKTVAEAEAKAARAAELLAACQKSLSRSFEPGEDAVRLERERDAARALIERATSTLAEAERGLADADEDLRERQKSFDNVEGVGKAITAPGLARELEESKATRAKAQETLAAARVSLQEEQAELQDKEDGLAALRDGPALRRTQTLLDNVGDDPGLAALIEKNKPSDFSGKAKAFFAPKNLLRKGVGFVPLVGLAVTYKEAVECEDQERSLNGATKLLDDTPVAKGLAESLSRSKEIEKWKKGFEFTAGFVTTAVTLPFAGALGPAMEPITAPISGAVGQAAAHVGGQTLGALAAKGATIGHGEAGREGRRIRRRCAIREGAARGACGRARRRRAASRGPRRAARAGGGHGCSDHPRKGRRRLPAERPAGGGGAAGVPRAEGGHGQARRPKAARRGGAANEAAQGDVRHRARGEPDEAHEGDHGRSGAHRGAEPGRERDEIPPGGQGGQATAVLHRARLDFLRAPFEKRAGTLTDQTELLRDFAARLGIPTPEPDESGLYTLFVGDDVPVFLQLAEDGSEALLFAGIGTIPEAQAGATCRALLQANHFWVDTGGFTLALIPNTLNVMLIARQALGVNGGAALHALFDRFASAAELWHRKLPTVAEEQAARAAEMAAAAA